jgi:hypothetical protein
MKNRLDLARFCSRCGVRLIKTNRSPRMRGCCQVCTTVRGRREARKSENRLRVPVAGFLPVSFWK